MKSLPNNNYRFKIAVNPGSSWFFRGIAHCVVWSLQELSGTKLHLWESLANIKVIKTYSISTKASLAWLCIVNILLSGIYLCFNSSPSHNVLSRFPIPQLLAQEALVVITQARQNLRFVHLTMWETFTTSKVSKCHQARCVVYIEEKGGLGN